MDELRSPDLIEYEFVAKNQSHYYFNVYRTKWGVLFHGILLNPGRVYTITPRVRTRFV